MSKIQNENIKTEAELIADGGAKSQLPNDDKVYVTANSLNKTLKEAITDGDIGGGEANNLIEGNLDANVDGWTVYANSTASDIPDDFGGTPNANVTFTYNATTPLNENGDGEFSMDAADRQGHGVYYEFSISRRFRTKVLTGIVSKDTSSSDIADGDYRYVVVFSNDDFVSNFQVTRVTPEDVEGSENDNVFQVQVPHDATKGRFCIHRAVTDATANSFNLANVFLGQIISQKGALVTDYIEYTPSSIGNATVDSAYYKQVGDSFFGIIEVTASSSAAPSFSVTPNGFLPSGLSVDLSKFSNFGTAVGNWFADDVSSGSGSDQFGGEVILNGNSDIFFVTANNDVIDNSTPFTWASGDKLIVKFEVPIKGWSSNTQMSSDFGNREVYTKISNNSIQNIVGDNTTQDIEFNTVNVDKTGLADLTSNYITIKEKGIYLIRLSAQINGGGGSYNIRPNKDGSSGPFEAYQSSTVDSGGRLWLLTFAIAELAPNDNIGGFVDSQDNTDSTYDVDNAVLEIVKLSSPQTLLGPAKVCFKATSDNGQSLTSGTLEFENVVVDLFGAYNPSTGEYTLPFTGEYLVGATVSSGYNPSGDSNSIAMEIRKNDVVDTRKRTNSGSTSTALIYHADVHTLISGEKGDLIKINSATSVTANMTTSDEENVFFIVKV